MVMNIFLFTGLTISLIANASLATYILIKKIKSPAAFYYFLFMVAVTLHVAGDLLFQLSTTIALAKPAMYAYWIGLIALATLFFLFASNFPRSRKSIFENETQKLFILVIPLIIIYLLIFSDDFLKNIIISDTGVNYVEYGSIYTLAILHLIVFLCASFGTLLIEFVKSNIESEKRNIIFVFAGVFIASIIGLPVDVVLLKLFGFGELKITSILMLFGCIIISYVVVQHKMFVINPVSEETTTEKIAFAAERGKIYSFDEKNEARRRAFRIFANQVKHNRQGLLVSTIFPEQVRKLYAIPKTPIIWISDSEGDEEEKINPKETLILNRSIFGFMEKAESPIILLEGVSRLIIENGSTKTVEFLNSLIKKSEETKTTVLFSLRGKETEFVKLFSENSQYETDLADLNKKFYSRQITEEVLIELATDLEKKLIQNEAQLKLIEDELLGKFNEINPLLKSRKIIEKQLQIINYKSGKRLMNPKISNELTKVFQKELVAVDQQLKKKNLVETY
jgi:hypothetical protein